MTTDHYHELAEDYEWMEPDALRFGHGFLAEFAHVLAPLRTDARILDCACGTGSAALAMARAGHVVSACDLSHAMVERTRERAEAESLELAVEAGDWASLPERYAEPFALVFCVGNSLVHADGPAGMLEALTAMRAVLEPGGTLVLDSRDWERLRAERPRVTLPTEAVRRGERRCYPMRLWSIPDEWDAPHLQEPLLLFDGPDGPRCRRFEVPFVPFRREALAERLAAAGFADVRFASAADGAWYHVHARAA